MRRSTRLLLLPLLVPSGAGGQLLVQLGDVVVQADMLYFADEVEAAYELLSAHVLRNPDDYEALWRTARAGVVLGLAEVDNREQNQYLDPALHWGRLAVNLKPDALDGRYWRGVAAGRRAMNAAAGYATELAQITHEDAHVILAADSLHSGAHNMLGKLNYEIMTLSRIERFTARVFMSNEAIKSTSWQRAEAHLERAVELDPDFPLFHYDLGRLYERRGRDAEAVVHLSKAATLPGVLPIDGRIRERAQALLDELIR